MLFNYDPLLNYVTSEDIALNEYTKLEYRNEKIYNESRQNIFKPIIFHFLLRMIKKDDKKMIKGFN